MMFKCPILDRVSAVYETDFSREPWSIVRCQETDFVFLANPPEYSQLETEFAWEKTSSKERIRREKDEPVISRLSSFAKKVKSIVSPGRNKMVSVAIGLLQAADSAESLSILDIGSGCGSLLVDMHNRFACLGRKLCPIGIEVSRDLASRSQEKVAAVGGRIICSNAMDGASELQHNSVHLVLMSSFLEHERQPLKLLKRLQPILTSEGVIVLKVPNFASWNRVLRGRNWCGFRFPDHVNYFTPKTLERLAKEAGFRVLRQNFMDKFPLSDNMYAVLTRR